MTHDQKRARLETLLRKNDLSLARVSVAIGRNKTYLQQYLRRGMPAVLPFQDTEALGRLLGCDSSELRHETRPARAPQPRTRRHPPRRSSLVPILEITINPRADADTIAGRAIVKSGVRRVVHAAALLSSMSSMPSLNWTPSMTFARWRKPRSRRQYFSAHLPILKIIDSMVCRVTQMASTASVTRGRLSAARDLARLPGQS